MWKNEKHTPEQYRDRGSRNPTTATCCPVVPHVDCIELFAAESPYV